jgi:hypothetical protein
VLLIHRFSNSEIPQGHALGITNQTCKLLGEAYRKFHGVDVRQVHLPALLHNVIQPGDDLKKELLKGQSHSFNCESDMSFQGIQLEMAVDEIMKNTVYAQSYSQAGHYDVMGMEFNARILAKAMKKLNPDC